MSTAKPVTFVEKSLARRRRRRLPLSILLVLLLLIALFAVIIGVSFLFRAIGGGPVTYKDDEQHFLHGSIGSETASGLPIEVWNALPALFPEDFEGRDDYAAFGFLYAEDEEGRDDLPIGISRRSRLGIEQVWFNCAVCHAGTWRAEDGAEPEIVAGMPSNNLDLHRFIAFLLDAADSPRLAAEPLFEAIDETGGDLGPIDRALWKAVVVPQLRETLLANRAALVPLLQRQPTWGPGRVDTFNPYKALAFGMDAAELDDAEVIGASDFPSIFLQGPREGMYLHWDGNNPSLAERNLSAALGAGVTPDTVDHEKVQRVARWLSDLAPPPSPHKPDPDAVARGAEIYAEECLACHGRQGPDGYVFEGDYLGQVEPLSEVQTDRARLDSYTQEFRDAQIRELFKGTRYAFRQFRKTDGYANMPLDGLWLRGPYLHNGSVPTLADLLEPAADRPVAFLRQSDVIDLERGGFVSPPCEGASKDAFCFDTRERGNSNSGHEYGTGLGADAKADLLAYLLTF